MTRSKELNSIGAKSLLSVDEASILLGITRSTAYRAISTGTFPVPIIRLGGRFRVSKAALLRLINDGEIRRPDAMNAPQLDLDTCPNCGGSASLMASVSLEPQRRLPMCSAARRSSSGTESV